MKTSHLRSLLIATAFAVPALARAHPGHDGDHDFVWDYSHLASHPLATLACVSVLVAAAWGGWRLVKSRSSISAERAKRD